MKILVAIDPPETGDVVIAAVAKRPWPPNTTVEVLSVVEPHRVFDMASLVEGLEGAAKDATESGAEQLRSVGLMAIPCVRHGDPKAAIVERAQEIGADLVLVGSRGRKGMERFLLGSVAAAVARLAPCSVEIVRDTPAAGQASNGLKILLATDGSECSQLAARSIAGRPWPAGTSVRVLSIAELSIPLLSMPYFSPSAMEKLRGDAMQRAEQAEMGAQEILATVEIEESGTVAVPTATPKELILQNAEEWGANLIVCGSHGRRGLGHFLLGSVSEAVARHARCSVEIIRQARP